MDFISINEENISNKKLKLLFLFCLIATIPVFLVITSYKHIFVVVLFGLFPFILLSAFNFRILLSIFVASFFVNFLLAEFKITVLLVPLIFVSFLITQNKFKIQEFKNPLTYPIIFYIITIIPSYFNCTNIPGSLLISLNFVAFLIIIYFIPVYLKGYNSIAYLLKIYLIMALLNALFVDFISLKNNERFFGFAGVVYVDYVNIAILISLIFLLFHKRSYKIVQLGLLITFLLASILMQTRNAWIALALTLFVFILFILWKYKKFGLNRIKAGFLILAVIIILAGSAYFVKSMSSGVSKRVTELTVDQKQSSGDMPSNSIVTRLLIWDTALNGFKAHPVFGIGFYSFPLESKYYYTIPKFLYDQYVKKLTPHVGYLAVVTETGSVGLAGFLIFIFFTIKMAFDSFILSKTNEEIVYSSIILWCLVYIAFSLVMTDAWLWGSGIMVWGMFLSFGVFNFKQLKSKYFQS